MDTGVSLERIDFLFLLLDLLLSGLVTFFFSRHLKVFLAHPSGSLHRLPSYLFIRGRIVGSGLGALRNLTAVN